MMKSSWKALIWIATAELFALSLWFGASVTAPELNDLWDAGANLEAWLSASVPIGFVLGAFASSYFGLADRFNPRFIFAVSALLGAAFNGLILISDGALNGITLRILTGVTLAGVYPTAVKLLSQWFPKRRGLAIGVLIAALTLGSSLPHFIVLFFSALQWQWIILTSSFLSVVSSGIIYFILKDAPVEKENKPFSFSLIKKVRENRAVMLANYGYFGHMWELYAMWTWLPVFLSASFQHNTGSASPALIAFCSFLTIGIAGAAGSVAGGWLADRIGRASLTILSMGISALCALSIGFTFGQSFWVTISLAFIWGIFIISDSAQFSAAVTEFAESEYVGTALTFQMCIGFLITIVSINLIPYLQQILGWKWVFSVLAIGPLLGLVSMAKFKTWEKRLGSPEQISKQA
ncbi:MFS transporter [Bacillus salacetis]|uniref:MFS transporter n=1 Tax=Bacillus salacetis TaxID=2315464 RepID=UPI003BA2A713